jgi:hypothetical protein
MKPVASSWLEDLTGPVSITAINKLPLLLSGKTNREAKIIILRWLIYLP